MHQNVGQAPVFMWRAFSASQGEKTPERAYRVMNPPTPDPLAPADAEARFAEMLDDAGLPRFETTYHDSRANTLEFTWPHGLTLCMDLSGGEIEPLDEWERSAILGGPICECEEPLHLTVVGSPDDPRTPASIPGVQIHHVPELHPDDVTTINGLPVTPPSRTLIDLAECLTIDELREAFRRARDLGVLDEDALRAARARVEWRPSLAMFDEVMEEFWD